MLHASQPGIELLQKLLNANEIGWWKVNFKTEEITFSEFAAHLFGLPNRMLRIPELIALVREDYRSRICYQFLSVKVEERFNEICPMTTPEGEVWIRVQLVQKQIDEETGLLAFGSIQKIEVQDKTEAERLTLESNYKAVLRENKHMDELLDHLPIGYFRLKLLYNQSGEAVDYLFINVNRAAIEILGTKTEDYTGKIASEIGITVSKHIHMLSHVPSGAHVENEWEALRTGRSCRSFIYNTPNDDSEIVILFLDITETIEAHRALEKSEKLLRNIFQSAPVGIGLYDKEGRLLRINDTGMEIFGIDSEDEVLGLRFFDNPNIPDEIKSRIQNREEVDFTTRYYFDQASNYHQSSRTGYVDCISRIRYLYDSCGMLTNYLIINIDNTRLLSTENQVAEFESLFRLVAEYANVGYANYNLCTGKGDTRGAWQQNYGEWEDASISDVIGIYSHLHPEDREIKKETLRKFACGEITSSDETARVLHPDGHVTWTRTHMLCRDYRPAEGIIDLVGISYDVTALKQTEQQLIAAKERAEEANKLKSAFIANMSHEIRTPLNAIVGFSELLTEEEDTATRKEYSELITRNNALLLQLVSDILDLSRIESGRQEFSCGKIEVRQFCADVIRNFQPRMQEKPDVQLLLTEGLPEVTLHSDKQSISHVLTNFIGNALKFTDTGSITLGYKARKDQIEFYVRDTGIGIPPEHQSRVFERFYKVDTFRQGTGLGLAICKSIVEQMDGSIGVDSTPGKGSIFRFTLPCGS